jgi:hypothetical protein
MNLEKLEYEASIDSKDYDNDNTVDMSEKPLKTQDNQPDDEQLDKISNINKNNESQENNEGQEVTNEIDNTKEEDDILEEDKENLYQ